MALPKYQDLTGKIGDSFTHTVTWQNASGTAVDLTGYTAKFQVRETKGAASPDINLSIGSGLTVSATTGQITITVDPTTTAALADATTRDYNGFYELQVTSSGGAVTTLMEGKFRLTEQVAV